MRVIGLLSGTSADGVGATAVEWPEGEAASPFDLEAGPLMRATLLRFSDEEHGALLTMHHVVSDGWSMGVVLYQALSGERPFEAESIPGLLHMIATERPEPLSKLSPELPRVLTDVIDKALAYDAEDRHH